MPSGEPLKGTAQAHDFAHTFHLGTEQATGTVELQSSIEDFHHDVIHRGFETGVSWVMSLSISSKVIPMACLCSNLAIGNPVALEASAEERETRGFISMTKYSPLSGLTEN